ncbi:MAG: peptide chain release factor-like protein [Elusimicrobia bacterium CG03_land_8_20_14_0_80_50_18]|nr:MAG: peptide chain release factor-like protein [Elusimicrobia bacterium CG03_land_8_20_14_0_80_50_18]PIX15111.1 MAG: peptide chain release factor-like protein [Elusimicrobia bacterium CG_4_8_14_3_um_filter_50_9]
MINANKVKALEKRLAALGIKESDIEEKFTRASGHGGQKLNKTSSCVFLKHIPSGILVKCSADRLRESNRFFARRILADKIEDDIKGAAGEKAKKIHKLRKQKNRRSKKAKEKVLELKRMKSEKKQLRKKPEGRSDCD